MYLHSYFLERKKMFFFLLSICSLSFQSIIIFIYHMLYYTLNIKLKPFAGLEIFILSAHSIRFWFHDNKFSFFRLQIKSNSNISRFFCCIIFLNYDGRQPSNVNFFTDIHDDNFLDNFLFLELRLVVLILICDGDVVRFAAKREEKITIREKLFRNQQ